MTNSSFKLSTKVALGIVLAVNSVVFVIAAMAPVDQILPAFATYVVVVSASMLYLSQRAKSDPKLKNGLKQLASSEYWDAKQEMLDRIIPGGILIIMLILQVLIASESLSQADQTALRSLFDLGVVTVGAFELVGYMIFYWIAEPLIKLALKALVKKSNQREVSSSD